MAWLLDSALSEANCRPTRHWFRHSIRIGTFAGQEQNAYVWLCKKKLRLPFWADCTRPWIRPRRAPGGFVATWSMDDDVLIAGSCRRFYGALAP